jgi:TolB-like protein/Tfp pilus assembly protein PilF
MSFFEELKRRSVVRVAILYGVATWLILQIADVLFPNLGAPDWAFGLVLGLLLLFFFPVLIFAWIYEITPDGLRKEKERDASRPVDSQTGRKTSSVTIALLLIVIVGVIYDRMNPPTVPPADSPADAQENVIDVVEPAQPDTTSPEPSIAVLPFETRSDDRQDAYFAAGIHDDLLTQLAKIHDIKVISRTSVMQYASTTKPMREIAEELQVATVLEGGVQRSGDRIRVNVQLIDAHTDKHLWAESYDEELTAANIFSIQSRLATSIAQALQAELSPAVQQRIADTPTDNLEAWNLTSRADYILEQEQSQQNLEAAVDLYRQAIEEDSEYAAAWAGLSLAINELVSWYYWPESSLDEAWRSALTAIVLDPDLAEGHFAHGDLLRIERRFGKGEQAFRRGLALSPGSADGYSRYGDILRDAGRFEESVLQSRKGVELDPRRIRTRVSLLQNLYFSRAWDAVIEEARKTLEMEDDTAEAWYWIALASAWKGEYDDAIVAAKKAVTIDPDTPFTHSGVAYVHSMAGSDEEALSLLKNAEKQNWPPAEVGLVYGWLGDLDEAFAHMDRAFEERPSGLHYIAADPAADPLRSDPRWAEFLERLTPD